MSASSSIGTAARCQAAAGALLAAAAVALSAYAAHGVDGDARTNLQTAALFFFGHGIALSLLPRIAAGRLQALGSWLLLAGTLAFGGALVSKYGLGVSLGRLAPFGGATMILGWLVHAVAALRR